MSSILTNNGAMVALQTLRSVNSNLAKTQSEISTGKTVATAKDNASIWSISKVMESDVKGFQSISDSLSLGESTLAVASTAAEKITDLLKDMKATIVSAQSESANRATLQTDVDKLRDQIKTIVEGAQFNGVNLLKGTESMDLLSSLDRNSNGTVAVSNIIADRNDLTTSAGKLGTGAALTAPTVSASPVANTAKTATLTIAGSVAIGDTFTFKVGDTEVSFAATAATVANVATGLTSKLNELGLSGLTAAASAGVLTLSSTKAFDATALVASNNGSGTSTLSATTIAARAETVTFGTTAVAEGDGYRVVLGGQNFDYVAGKGETMEDVARGLKGVIDSAKVAGISTNVRLDSATNQWSLQIDNNSSTSRTLTASGAKGGTATGGLQALAGIDVTTKANAQSALANIETLIQSATSAAASFGASSSRVSIQNDFVTSLTDTMKTGIGSLVDADMEETSARLQALQTQQQLAVQSLSIANQAPQSILSLFR
ncbi:flagellin [Rubellimicrobium aerolatum]|uniref:Flagellin n=1 Tax=Rubellimicrobium aerolatum TaxID=490979 RepID=A0ABW0S9S3_9RHOB|nr:flagellin [Rubellimicrobium aerolatum]MBP1805060.1 flagellin [Rubellimicrobium aerolatum]